MRGVVYDYSSVHIDVPDPISKEIIDWGSRKIPDRDLFVATGMGRENEMHITVLYGIHAEKPDEVKDLIVGTKPFPIVLGKLDIFTSADKYDVVVVEAISPELVDLHEKLKQLDHTNKYPKFRPHVTVAYVKKDRGWSYKGASMFADKAFEAKSVTFSSRKGMRQRIPFDAGSSNHTESHNAL